MNRYFLEIAYHGKNYHGWQIQPNSVTVQQEITEKLSTLLQEEIAVVGSGRTDSGVHCKQQFAHFETAKSFDFGELRLKLNSFLSSAISILSIRQVKSEAHARFDATFRRYEYHIITQKNPFKTDLAWHVKKVPDFHAMNEAALHLKQYENFESFSKTHTQNDHFRCTIEEARWEQTSASEAIFHIKANRFLRGMVRLIVGELMKLGTGKKTLESFLKDIEARTFGSNRTAAPAHGLFLCEVGYPEEIFL